MLTLRELSDIALLFWPGTSEPYLGNKAALVHDVEIDAPIPTMSQKDRERIKVEIAKVEAWKVVLP
jgi:hypothetical protein